ncbi:hypothetical protein STAS_32206 [Striga asiatica]|uniref:Uncharacterized protein n=1 Tax=Striga asiatica TaxID=4170 RepID=A0A5A7RAV6_STRAF|nr:hypothetical protein STAS_32206 [Striga asiatica]
MGMRGNKMMWVIGVEVVGLMNIAGYLTQTKELRWLSSVYDLTGAISSLLFKGYNKLNDKEKLEWNNNLFDEAQDGLIVHRSSTLSDAVLGVSIGYFLSDLSMIFYHYPALGGMEYVARVVLFMFFFYHIFIHYDQVKQIFPLGFYSLFTVPAVVSLMNCVLVLENHERHGENLEKG